MKPKGQLSDAEAVDLETFLSRDSQRKIDGDEYIHVLFDRQCRRIALFRSIGECGNGEWLRTDVDGFVQFSNRESQQREPESFYLTWTEASTLLTLLDRYRVERSDAELRIDWWENNSSPMLEEHDLQRESLYVSYKTDSGRSNRVEISDCYDAESTMMAKF